MLSTLTSGYKACLQGQQLLLGAVATVAQQEVCSGGQSDNVVAVGHKTVGHNKKG